MTTQGAGRPLHRRLSDDQFEPLSREDQERLAAALSAALASGDEKARLKVRDELIHRHLRLVSSIASGYLHKLEQEDAFAIGAMALTNAMDRWNPAPGGMSPYQWARRWITSALNRAGDAARQIKIPEHVAYPAALATKAVKEAEAAVGRSLTSAEIVELTGGATRLEDLPIADVSLEQPPRPNAEVDDGVTIIDVIADHAVDTEQVVELEDRAARVRQSLASLNDQERTVVAARFGIGGAAGKTLAELGRELGITGEAVRRLEASALAKLQHPANPIGIGEL